MFKVLLSTITLLLPLAQGEEERFLVLGKNGDIIAGPMVTKALPHELQPGQTLAWTSLQESWFEDFHEILACWSAGEWNLTGGAKGLVQAAVEANRAGFIVNHMPIESGVVLLVARDKNGLPERAGIFRCYLATDPGGLFKDLPLGDYLVVLFGQGGYLDAKEIVVDKPWQELDWRTLKRAKPGKKELLPFIRRRVSMEVELEGGSILE